MLAEFLIDRVKFEQFGRVPSGQNSLIDHLRNQAGIFSDRDFEQFIFRNSSCSAAWVGNVESNFDRDNTAAARIRGPLLDWADRYRLRYEWMLSMALDACLIWCCSGPPYEFRFREFQPRSEGISTFKYPAWDGRDEKEYLREVCGLFEQHLNAEIAQQLPDRVKATPLITRTERFDMMALYLCKGMTPQVISTRPGLCKDPDVVRRELREVAALIGVRVRGKGRPSKTD
ncbi:MAG TPA: hypothetical protein VM120_26050 [Bryobacteraceae bacterium]|nr:hypothetical protein [Bryobacteraceae bacterium]